MKWIEVPEFGIKYFKTIKDGDSLDFRPSATTLEFSDSLKAMNEEKVEQNEMIDCVRYIKPIQANNLYSPKIIPAEITQDTQWYESDQQPKTKFVKVKNYDGQLDFDQQILLPIDVSLYIDEIDLSNNQKIHWATSGGFANSKIKDMAIAKGISELVENHFKMYWWFNKTKIYLINNKILKNNDAFFKLNAQSTVCNVSLYLLEIPEKVGSYVAMCVLETKKYPYLSLGFGTNNMFDKAITHAIYEAIHYYRGTNWYRLIGEDEKQYIAKNKDMSYLIKDTLTKRLFEKEEFSNISSNIITDRFTFFAKVIHSSELGITTKVFSTELQPIINSKYVPFFYQDFNTKDNVKRREKYNGVPFI